ncbi:Tenascin-X, partial [Camelus dromedarius]
NILLYKMHLYGLHGGRRVGPVSTVGVTAPDYEAMTTQAPPTEAPEPPIKPRLGELAVTDASPDSLSLSWTVPEGQFDHFLVQYKNGDGQPKAVRVPGHEDGVTVSGLEPDHKYKMNLYGFHDGQRLGPVSVIGVTSEWTVEAQGGTREDPPSLRATRLLTVQYKGRDGPQVVRVGGEESEVTVGGLEPGRKYKMHLYGLHGGRRVGPVSTMGVDSPSMKLLPAGGADSDGCDPRLHDPVLDSRRGRIDSFVVQYKDRTGSPSVPVAPDQHEITIPGLEPNRKYSFCSYGLQAVSDWAPSLLTQQFWRSPRDSSIGTGRPQPKVSWVPPPSEWTASKCPTNWQMEPIVFSGEPLSMQVDGEPDAETRRVIPGARSRVTWVSVVAVEESEPLTGFLQVPDGPTQLGALNLTEGSALLHWSPPRHQWIHMTSRSRPRGAVDYPLHDLVLHTNYTDTARLGAPTSSPPAFTLTTGNEARQLDQSWRSILRVDLRDGDEAVLPR